MGQDIEAIQEDIREYIMASHSNHLTTAEISRTAAELLLDRCRHIYLSLDDRCRILRHVVASVCGMDVLEDLLADDTVDEIMVMGTDKVYTERSGKLYPEKVRFKDEERLMSVIRRIAVGVDRQVNQASPIADLRMRDGSRVNVILPPISLDGPVLTIRKFSPSPFTLERLRDMGSISSEQEHFLRDIVVGRKNVFVSGGTGTGKTSLLNALSREIPSDERVVTIEDSAELKFDNVDNLVRLECRTANMEGNGAVDMEDLIRTSLRLRPDRIIVGEVRGKEVVSMLQAMNTGHSGSMSTGHGNSPQDMLVRLETMVLMGMEIPLIAARMQISSAIDYIVHLERMPDHRRRVSEIVEVVNNGDKNEAHRVC